ncbi:MAG: DUF4349 domain-containing protein [Actinomycetota bacterium]
MTTSNVGKRIRLFVVMLLAAALVLGACSSAAELASESMADTTMAASEYETEEAAARLMDEGDAAGGEEFKGVAAVPAPIGTDIPDGLKVIRDGRVEIRVEPGTFGQVSSQLRSIAQDLGGYITAGETHLQEIDDVQYTVGWLTMRIPVDRFDDALNRVDGLGERLSLNVSSQDVTEEYVDLEGRLRYWKSQEEFYSRLMDEATDIDDLVTIQTRMQDVLLNIEQIEGRLRYLDSRTSFSTLTVGLTEVPGEMPIEEPDDPTILSDAIDQAGTVLLATIGGLIVAGAFALPILLLALIGFGLWRAIASTRRRSSKSGSGSAED